MGSAGRREQYGQVFDAVAAEYDAHRSGYPATLVDLAMARGGLAVGSRVVEVGCGTGKLTELLAARGLVVDAVDPGENMIAAARRRVGDDAPVTFHVGRFEDVELPEETYAALFSATAFHWIDPHIGWQKAASLLQPGGLLALLVHTGLRTPESARFEEELIAILGEHAPEIERNGSRSLDVLLDGVPERSGNVSAVWDWLMSDGRHELAVPAAASLFDDVDVASETRVIDENADQMLALFKTTSLWYRVPAERRDQLEADDRALIERHGGSIRTTIGTFLMTARRA